MSALRWQRYDGRRCARNAHANMLARERVCAGRTLTAALARAEGHARPTHWPSLTCCVPRPHAVAHARVHARAPELGERRGATLDAEIGGEGGGRDVARIVDAGETCGSVSECCERVPGLVCPGSIGLD